MALGDQKELERICGGNLEEMAAFARDDEPDAMAAYSKTMAMRRFSGAIGPLAAGNAMRHQIDPGPIDVERVETGGSCRCRSAQSIAKRFVGGEA